MAKIKRISSIEELYGAFGHLFPDELLKPADKGPNSRERIFSGRVTFWAFAAQILSPGTSCAEIVRRVDAWWQYREGRRRGMSDSSGAYCQARARLDPDALELIAGHLSRSLEANSTREECWLEGRNVKIVDGTGLSMPDTPENQAVWPQSSGQKPGCGFPMMKLVGLFSLSSGAMLEGATGSRHVHESLLFRELWPKLRRGDIVLGDRGFCSYAAMASLGRKGVDSVLRLHQMRKADFRTGKPLGVKDRLVTWSKPAQRTGPWSEEEFAALPDTLELRMIEIHVEAEGFRTRKAVVVTTLLDPEAYPADEIRSLYGRRWRVELHFNQIKTLLAMDVLRCRSPEMIEREVLMHRIAYNLVRSLMQQSAHLHRVPLERISFKGALDTIRHWADVIAAAGKTPRKQDALIARMLEVIASGAVIERPGRSEPRAKKGRPKNYQLLTRPRSQMGNLPRRNRPGTKAPKPALS